MALSKHITFSLFNVIILMTTLMPIKCDATTTTTPKPKRTYPFRTMIGNMYHRLRNHRTGYLLIPPLLRLAYQYGPNLIERMGNALGLGASGAASDGIEGLVQSALSGAFGGGAGGAGQVAGAAAQVPGALGSLSGGLPGAANAIPFGAAPLGFGPRPVFFRR